MRGLVLKKNRSEGANVCLTEIDQRISYELFVSKLEYCEILHDLLLVNLKTHCYPFLSPIILERCSEELGLKLYC